MNICVILTPRIGAINKELAGTEGMFINDLNLMIKRIRFEAYARFSYKHPNVNKSYYPLFIKKIARQVKFLKRYYNSINNFCDFVAEIIYVFIIYLKSLDSDVIFGYSCAIVSLLPFRNRIIFLHSYEKFYFTGILYRQYSKSYYIFCSKYLRDYFMNKYKFINFSNSTYIHNAIDTKIFYPLKASKNRGTKIRLLYVSAWVKEKGLDILLKSILRLPKTTRKKIVLNIASSKNLWYKEKFERNDKYIRKVNALISKFPNVLQMGGVKHSDMNQVYNNNDYLIFPSTWGEPCSLSLIEAVFSRIPVIAFNVGGNQEILSKNNSILLNTPTVNSLSQTLFKIANGKYHFKRISPTRKNYFMTSEKRAPKFLKLIDRVKIQISGISYLTGKS